MGKLRRIAGAGLRLMQGFGLYRRIGRCLIAQSVTYREASDADKLAVHHWLNPKGDPAHVLRRNSNVTDFVADYHGQLMGFVQLVRHPPEHFPYTGNWLFALYVKSLWQRLGVGQALSQAVIERARAESAQTLDLLVFNDNFRAIQLYYKLGFEMHTIPELEAQLELECAPSGRRRVVMRKRLEKQE
jgi:ribosomal protein S18 acetylase RimI-like enzyme